MSIEKVKRDEQEKQHGSRNGIDASQQMICELSNEELELVTGAIAAVSPTAKKGLIVGSPLFKQRAMFGRPGPGPGPGSSSIPGGWSFGK